MKKHRAFLPLVLLAGACAVRIAPPRVPSGQAVAPDSAWANVLSRFVDDKGAIDFAGLAGSPSDLETYLAYLAKVSPAAAPDSFPTPQIRLTFYINAYNALAMYDVLRSGIPPDLSAVRIAFFSRNQFALGGEYVSLYTLENRIVRPLGDPRVHFALNCMARSCPRLPREPFRAELLDAELQACAQYFFSEARNVELLPGKKTVRFNQILEFYREDFLTRAPSLIAFANMYRDEKIPADWKVEFIPFDWRLNSR